MQASVISDADDVDTGVAESPADGARGPWLGLLANQWLTRTPSSRRTKHPVG